VGSRAGLDILGKRNSVASTDFRTPNRPASNEPLQPLSHDINTSQRDEELPQPLPIYISPHTGCSGIYIQLYTYLNTDVGSMYRPSCRSPSQRDSSSGTSSCCQRSVSWSLLCRYTGRHGGLTPRTVTQTGCRVTWWVTCTQIQPQFGTAVVTLTRKIAVPERDWPTGVSRALHNEQLHMIYKMI